MCSENKALISFAVTAKLICVFVFAYAKSRFSHDTAQILTITPLHPSLESKAQITINSLMDRFVANSMQKKKTMMGLPCMFDILHFLESIF